MAGDQAAYVTAPRSTRRRLQQRGAGEVDTSSSSAVESDAQSALRRANNRKIRSSSSDAATSTDVETPARPVSPRRISDPICQHSGSQVHSVESPWNSVPLPTAAPPSARVPPRSIVTTAQMHAEPQMSAESGTDPLPLAPAGRSTCLPGELQSDTDSRHHCWRLPSSTPTARREHIAELQQQRAGTSSSLGSLHHQRLASSVSSPVAAGFGPRHGDPDTCRGVVPGHLLYRRPAACRSETASPDIDYDDDDDDGLNLTSSATRDRPWHVRRHLKAISERSQSTDTIYV